MDTGNTSEGNLSNHLLGRDAHQLSSGALALDPALFPMERYQPISQLGKGSAGIVYLCLDRLLGKQVAIKCLRSVTAEQLIGFQSEAKASSLMNHIGVVAVLDFGVTSGGAPYMVMEYAEGQTLEQRIAEKGPLEPELAVKVFIRIADALGYAHAKGIYHRDLKSSNILILDENSDDPDVRLIDFGVARIKHAIQASAIVQGLTIVGTPAYMPPDQAAGLPYDARSEIYAFGCTMFEGLTGRTPFVGETALEIIAMHSRDRAPTLSEVRSDIIFPDGLESIIQTCLSKNKNERFESMTELVNALQILDSVASVFDSSADRFDEKKALASRRPKPILVYAFLTAVFLSPVIICFSFFQTKDADDRAKPITTSFGESQILGVSPSISERIKPRSRTLVEQSWQMLSELKTERAISLCNEALKIDKNNLRAFDVRAVAKFLRQQKSEALNDLNRSISRRGVSEREDASAFFHRGIVKQSIGDTIGARQDFREAIVLGGYLPEAWELKQFGDGIRIWKSENDVYDRIDYGRGVEHRGSYYKIVDGKDSDLSALVKPQNPPIRDLLVRGGIFSGKPFEQIAELESIRAIEFADVEISDSDLKFLSKCTHLDDFAVTRCPKINGSFLQYLANLDNLRQIQIKGGGPTDDELKYLRKMKSLKSFGVLGCPGITGSGFSYLPGSIERIDWLPTSAKDIPYGKIDYSRATFARINKLPNLTALTLNPDLMDDTANSALSEVKRLRALILIGREPIRPQALDTFRNLNLERLEFRNVRISPAAMEKLGRYKKLKTLVFSDGCVDSVSLATLARLPIELQGLGISEPKLDGRMLLQLGKLKGLTQLRIEEIPSSISQAEIDRLKTTLPNCRLEIDYAKRGIEL